jgi:peptide/nickel transport system substrate-binding protein
MKNVNHFFIWDGHTALSRPVNCAILSLRPSDIPKVGVKQMGDQDASKAIADASAATTGRRDFIRGAGALGVASALLGETASRAKAATPKRGGNLRLGMTGGSSSDTIAASNTVTELDNPRILALFEPLVSVNRQGIVSNVLADSFEPNSTATEWTIRLRDGLTFHNGKTVTSKDVLFSLQRIVDPKSPLPGATSLAPVDLANAKCLDGRTLRLPMKTPYADFPGGISAPEYFSIVPVGYDVKNPVGTGPFKYQSFTPGQQSVYTRNENYWRTGQPYLDTLTIIDFPTDDAAFSALQGGIIDVFAIAPIALMSEVRSGGSIKALVSQPGQWVPFTMRVDSPPFDDQRVRQAMRLLVDRQQMVDVALGGYGAVGNDVFSPWDSCYDATAWKRDQDVDKAKFLLKQAGHADLTVDLVTSDIASGAVRMAEVLAQQAQSAGVTINLRKVTTDVIYGPQYLNWPLSQDWWNYKPYLAQVAMELLKTSPFNETHWAKSPSYDRYNKLYNEAQATLNAGKRCDIIHEMQKIDYEEGALIIPCFNKNIDLMTSNVNGFQPSNTGYALGNFGFADAWLG